MDVSILYTLGISML